MTYRLEPTKIFAKQLKKLDRFTQKQITDWLSENIHNCDNPRQHGKALIGNHAGQWRYRIGNYRVIVQIKEDKLLVLALEVGHRREIY